MSAREAYPEYSEGPLIGKALAGARYREGLTQIQLSEMTGIPQRPCVSLLVNIFNIDIKYSRAIIYIK